MHANALIQLVPSSAAILNLHVSIYKPRTYTSHMMSIMIRSVFRSGSVLMDPKLTVSDSALLLPVMMLSILAVPTMARIFQRGMNTLAAVELMASLQEA